MTLAPVYQLNVISPSSPRQLVDQSFQLPTEISIRPDGCIRIIVGRTGDSLPLDSASSLITAYPNKSKDSSVPPASATILKANRNFMAMEAAQNAARRLAQKFQRPISLTYPEEPFRGSDEQAFADLEVALAQQLKKVINSETHA